jgi:hypothetical protein
MAADRARAAIHGTHRRRRPSEQLDFQHANLGFPLPKLVIPLPKIEKRVLQAGTLAKLAFRRDKLEKGPENAAFVPQSQLCARETRETNAHTAMRRPRARKKAPVGKAGGCHGANRSRARMRGKRKKA